MKTIITIAALALFAGSANASCSVNWVNGDCGTPTSDASHHEAVYDSGNKAPKPDCPKKDGADS